MTSRSAAASSTERASGPSVAYPFSGAQGAMDTRPRDGLRPNTPQQDAGIRMEPAPSLPWEMGQRPAARAAAAPPLDPPVERLVSHGFRQTPFSSDSVVPMEPSSGTFVFPRN